jgi:hypothetical protein
MYWEWQAYFSGVRISRVPEGLFAVHQDQRDVIEARKGQREKLHVMRGRDPMKFPLHEACLSSTARCAVSNWRDLFEAALLRTNSPDLEQRVTAAQQAIDERMRELIQENIRASQEEREIRDAVHALKVLRREIEESKRRTAG